MKTTKKLNAFFIMLVACSSILISCKKTSTAPLGSGKSRISCDVSGATSGSFASNDLVSSALKNGILMNISGSTTSLPIQIMMFVIPTGITVGSHNLLADDNFNATYTKDATGWSAGNVGDNFTLVVTKNDGTDFEGTFSGVLTNDNGTSVTISNGKIAAKF